jgi:hypothetical protein
MNQKQSIKASKTLMCPSADPAMENPVIFGIVTGTPEQPQLMHLRETKQIPPELLALESPVKPTEIFRIAANCNEACQHFDGAKCRLSQRIIEGLPQVSETLPACAIRANCRWWSQEGKEACLRCLQIVRDNYIASEQLFQAADPSIYQSRSNDRQDTAKIY